MTIKIKGLGLDRQIVQGLINGDDPYELYSAFHWDSTEDSIDYWGEAAHLHKLTSEHIEKLQEILDTNPEER